MEGVSLTRGAIADISNGVTENYKPIVQVADLKLVQTVQNTTERYRMLLSDGMHAQQAMLATQMNALVKAGSLQKGSIVQLNEFICNVIQNRKIIIVLKLDVIVETCNTIGEPRNYDGSSAAQPRPSMPVPPHSGVQLHTPDENQQSNGGSLGGSSITGPSTTGTNMRSKMEPVTNTNPAIYGGSSDASFPSHNASSAAPMHPKTVPEYRSYGDSPQINNQRFSNPGITGGLRPPSNPYGRPDYPQYQKAQPPPLYQNRGPIAKNEAPARIIPIAALNPYQGRWTIKARVTAKGELRRYNSPRGEGKVFSFDLLDSDGGEIRVTCFNSVADQFYEQIDSGNVYMISKGNLKPAQRKFNQLKNDYEIHLDNTSTIQPCTEDNSIPKQQFNFRPISEIESMENSSMVDVIGIVSSISLAATIMTKNGTETLKRTLSLKDMSGRSVEITLWGNFCNTEGQQLQNMCDSGVFPVLAIKSGRVSDFSGKSVGTISTSQLLVDPDFPEADRLKDWYGREGKSISAVSISRETQSAGRTDIRKTVSQIKDEGLGRSEKPDWITIKAAISFIKSDNFCYTACPLSVGDKRCNKKVTNNGDGNWHCDRCDQSSPDCDYRYLLQFQIQDHTGLTWVTAFQEGGEELLGISAKELYLLKYEEQDDVRFADIIRGALFNQYLFKLKVKEETFSDEQRIKSTLVKAEKVNPSSESKYLLDMVDKLLGDPGAVSGRTSSVISDYRPNSGYGNFETKHAAFPAANSMGGRSNVDSYRTEAAPYQAGQYPSEYGSRGMQATCNSCGSTGHSAHNCPRLMTAQGQAVGGGYVNRTSNTAMGGIISGATSGNCYKCQQPGHWARDCPGSSAVPSAYGSSYRF